MDCCDWKNCDQPATLTVTVASKRVYRICDKHRQIVSDALKKALPQHGGDLFAASAAIVEEGILDDARHPVFCSGCLRVGEPGEIRHLPGCQQPGEVELI